MRHPLAETYAEGRLRLLRLAEDLNDAEAATRSTACPEWTVKDIYAHLAGIATDILAGNTSEAATPGWADGHVADRADRSLAEVVEEWTAAGGQVSELVETVGEGFPLELFVDQWTHEWDVRAALGNRAAAEPDTTTFDHHLEDFGRIMSEDPRSRGLPRLTVDVDGRSFDVGDGPEAGTIALSTFEFGRISMGRRSMDQLGEVDWPVADPRPHLDVLVRWSIADRDVIDPAIVS